MSRVVTAVREWISPNSISRSFIPPMDGGLRANDLLDDAVVLASGDDLDPEDILVTGQGAVVVSSGSQLLLVEGETSTPLAHLPGIITAMVEHAGDLVVAVEGHGLVAVDSHGALRDVCRDPAVRSCVTDMAADGELLVTVGSQTLAHDEWSRGLLLDTNDGLLVRVQADGNSTVVASGLAWPSGIALHDDAVVLALSMDYAIELRTMAALNRPGRTLLRNLPAYPGRVRVVDGLLWVAAPYARNRITEMFTDDSSLVRALLDQIDPAEWPVPRLRLENPYRDLMQLGQLRVLGVLKPWAPPRSYGLAFSADMNGLVRASVHSRVDGRHHGVTGIAVQGDRILLAVRGSRTVVSVPKEVLS